MCEFNYYLCQEMVGQWQVSRRLNVVDSNKMYLDLQVNLILTKCGFDRQLSLKSSV